MAATEVIIQKVVEIGKFSIVEVRVDLITNIAEFHFVLTDKDGNKTKNLFTQDLSQWDKFSGMVADLCAKAGNDIEKDSKNKLKEKEKNNV